MNDDLLKILNELGLDETKAKINSDSSVDYYDNIDLSNMKLHKIPIKFNRVMGYFNISSNPLTSLENCPKYVSLDFLCSNTNIKSLIGMPKQIGGSLICGAGPLESLEGCPSLIPLHFYCTHSNLKSLDHGPKYVSGRYICVNNKLESLEGAPKFCNSDFQCSNNKLTSFEHCPTIISGVFDCSYNNIESIDYCPKKVGQSFIFVNKPKTITEKLIRSVCEVGLYVFFREGTFWWNDGDEPIHPLP